MVLTNLIDTDVVKEWYKQKCDVSLQPTSIFDLMPCCNISDTTFSVKRAPCASQIIFNLVKHYTDKDTLFVISNAEHPAVINSLRQTGADYYILDYNHAVTTNFDSLAKHLLTHKYKRIVVYYIGTQLTTGLSVSNYFFISLKNLFNAYKQKSVFILDDCQGMYLIPRDYSIFDHVISTAHSLLKDFDSGIVLCKKPCELQGFSAVPDEYFTRMREMLAKRYILYQFHYVMKQAFAKILLMPDSYVFNSDSTVFFSVKIGNIIFTKNDKERLDEYHIYVELNRQNDNYYKFPFIRMRGQDFYNNINSAIHGLKILDNIIINRLEYGS